ANNEQLDVALNFGLTEQASVFEVYQNVPNPFNATSQISFTLPQASDVTITFNDVTGKVLKVVNGAFGAGRSTVEVKAEDLAVGVIYYTVETADQAVTKKMIVIE
ncbi:MAG: T9SS type A sorting domain-containing protein, partial [Bacteroidota bacterium]